MAGGNLIAEVAGTVDLKERDWVGNPGEETIKIKGMAEGFPDDPIPVLSMGAAR